MCTMSAYVYDRAHFVKLSRSPLPLMNQHMMDLAPRRTWSLLFLAISPVSCTGVAIDIPATDWIFPAPGSGKPRAWP